MKAEELYVFRVRLCDNEIDRDGEAFTTSALQKLAKMFEGKTGIFDHNPKGENQTARIFETEVEQKPEQKTTYGQTYACLNAKAYMVRNEKNAGLIMDIDAGIKKEVSVSCSTAFLKCSICGADWRSERCGHKKGEEYQNKICYGILEEPTDAYEWSFVAIPAQRKAGVIKSFLQGGEKGMECRDYKQLMKAFSQAENHVELTAEEARALVHEIRALEQDAIVGKEYLTQLRNRVEKMSFLVGEQIEPEVLESVIHKMDFKELKAYEKFYEKKLEQKNSDGWEEVQLAPGKKETAERKNQMFKI